ncbi:NlpC/P60 family N-terminal domain-containing protein [Geoalkalibacter sp.]|uniref:NlpC/P60 family N-terminal domain-containing protein n=1 Tax=Geoalkalibacter sp. TaxID=3041440 RepID=UPI00272EE466|nr:NlpC/P60 family N-terminal domain-containing protein [Geoalkalibacter sp.]
MRCLFLALTILLAAACAPRPDRIADLERYSQVAAAYLDPAGSPPRLVSAAVQQGLDEDFNRRFFAPWRQERASLAAAQAFWGLASYGGRQGYAENLQPLDTQRWAHLVASLNREAYPSLARPAISVRNTSLRVFPTQRPFFLDPRRPGEGYPFDYFQNSALWAGTPLFVTHVSADGAWFFAEAGLASGWLPALDLAWADEDFRRDYQTGRFAALLRDDLSLHDAQGGFLVQSHIGALFPLADQGPEGLRLLVPVRDADGRARIRTALVSAQEAAAKPLPLLPETIAKVADAMAGQLYGWGGLYENRDCSAFLHDLFTPFGVWLPRNSSAQAKAGTFIDLDGLSPAEKRERLLREGLPFYTLVWLQGHTALYLGPDPHSGEPLLLHNLWAARTHDWRGREGRALVGRLAVTSLHPGEERRDVRRNGFLERVKGLTLLPGVGKDQQN